MNTIWQSIVLLCLFIGINSSLKSEIPFLNDYLSGEQIEANRILNSSETFPFFSDWQRSRINDQHAGQLVMMDCFDVFTVGNDNAVAAFGDTITLIGTATNVDGGGMNTNFSGLWFVSDGLGSASMRGKFILPNGSPATELVPGTNIFQGSFAGDSDTILFLRDPLDPIDGPITDFEIVFQATNLLNGSCVQRDTNLVRIDLEPNLALSIDDGSSPVVIEAGANPPPSAMYSTAYCSGTSIDIDAIVERNPTLSGQPVFILTEVTDTSDQLGLAVLNGGTPLDGDTLYLTPNQLDLDPVLTNTGDEDIFVQLRLFPYYESDGTSTVPGTSTFTPGDDIIGDSVEYDFLVYSEPIASFGGNDTICYAADVPLDFTGTPNTRVYYRDTITGVLDSVDLDAQGRFVVTFLNVTTDLFFVIDSLVRLDPPFCAASPATIAGIAPQPFIVTDSLVATATALDSIACDTFSFATFDFVANDSASVYSFLLTNSLGNFDSTYFANGEDTLSINLGELNFGGVASTSVTFYLSQLVDTSSTFNCANAVLQDSFVVYVDPNPVLELTFNGQVDNSDNEPTLFDTICVTDAASYAGAALSTAVSGLPMYVREIDSLYNLETNTVVSIDTVYHEVSSYSGSTTLATPDTDTLVLVRTLLPYFESESGAVSVDYDDDSECAGDLIRLEVVLTPVPLEPTIEFSTDTICADGSAIIEFSNGTPGATVGYDVDNILNTVVLDGSGNANVAYNPTIDSGTVVVNLQFTAATCNDLISGSDTLFINPLPTGFLTVSSDSVCQMDSVYVVFNTNTTFSSELDIRLQVRNTSFNNVGIPNVNGNFMDGDTIFRGAFVEDRVFILRRVRYPNNYSPRCAELGLDTATVRVENAPELEIDFTEISVSPDMSTAATAPDSVYFEVCAGDSLYLDYSLPTIADTSRFNDSVFVALFINDPLGVTPAGAGTSMVMLDIDEMAGYDSLHLVNNTNDTARVEIIAVPFFTAVDGAGLPITPYADACKGDSIVVEIDVINNFVTTIGGNYEVCYGADTVVVITGPDFAEVDFVAITDNGVGGLDTSSVRTIELDNQGRYEIVIDSILQDTTYDLLEARLPGSGCPSNLGPNITVEVVPPPMVDFSTDSITVCEGVPFDISLVNGPAEGYARVYDSLGIDTFRVTLDDFGAVAIGFDSIMGSRKYYVDSVVYTNQMGLFCPTDTIVDSIYVTVIPAPRLSITTDTVCVGDTAYVTLVTTSTDSFNLVLDSAGVDVAVNGVIAGDTILAVNGITQDSFQVILESGVAINGSLCPAFPITQNLDTAYLRVDELPQATVQYSEPFALTVNASTSPDTLVVCEGTILTDTIFSTPDTSIAGFGFAISTTLILSDGINPGNPVFTDQPLRPEDLQVTMQNAPGIFAPDSTIITVVGVPYFPSDTLPGGFPLPFDPATDCAGDSVVFTLIVLPTPTANYVFGQDTICEDEITTVQILGIPGDTILFGVEGFGTTNIIIPADSTFEYQMPTVAQFDSASLANTFPPSFDDDLVFAILGVNSATSPSCSNVTQLFDTIHVERLPEVTASIPDTAICFGDDALVSLTAGTPGAEVFFTLDFANQADGNASVVLDAMGEGTLTIPSFVDTVTITLDSIVSASSLMCNTLVGTEVGTIYSVPLPDGEFVTETVCNGSTFYVAFNYTGDRVLGPTDDFSIFGQQPNLGGTPSNYFTSNTMNGDTIDFEQWVPGTYTYTIDSIIDNTTGCVMRYMPALTFDFVVEVNPAFEIEFTGGVENGQVFNTDSPPLFPTPGLNISNICSGTNLMTDIISSTTSSMGDPTNVRVTIIRDDITLFNGLPNTIDTTLSFLEFNENLNNNTDTLQRVVFRLLPYFETDAVASLDMDECSSTETPLTFVFNVFPNPVAEFVNMDTMRVCSGDSIFLKFDGSQGADVDFEDDDLNTYSATVSPNDSVMYVANQSGPDTVRFFITHVEQTFSGINQVCLGNSTDTVVLIVNPLPVPYLEFSRDTVCFNETVNVFFRDSVGTGPWTVVVNGNTYNPSDDNELLFTSAPITSDAVFTISAATDGNGCVAETVFTNVVFTDIVRVNEVPLLTTDLEVFDFVNNSQGTDQLVDGLLELDTFCSLQRLAFLGTTTTPNSLASDPLYVQVQLTGDVSTIWNGIYTGDTTFVVPVGDIPAGLNTPLIPNNTASTLAAQVILTPYFETNVASPSLDFDECEGAMDTLRISIDPRPNATSNQLDFEICSGDTFEFDPNTNISNLQAGTTYSYTVSNTGASTVPDRPVASGDIISDVITHFSTSSATVTYTITPFSPGGCEGDEFDVEVVVLPQPALVASLDTVCSREESNLEITRDFGSINPSRYIVADVIYNSDSLTGLDVIAVGDTFNRNQTVNNLNGNDNGFIRDAFVNVSHGVQRVDYVLVAYRIQTGCVGDTVTFSTFVQPEPLVMNLDTTVCTDVRLNIDLQSFVVNGVASDITWEAVSGDLGLVAGATTSPVNDNILNDSLRLISAAGTQQRQVTYEVTVAGLNGCPASSPNTFLYTVFVSPNIQLTTNTPDGDFICAGDPDGIMISAIASNTIGNVNYNWSIDDVDPGVNNPTIINPTGNGSTINVNATGNGQFTLNLLVDDEGGCTAMSSTTITVYDEIMAGFDTTYVGGVNTSTVDFADTSSGFPTAWLWTFDDPASGSSDTSVLQNPTHTFSGPGTYDVTLQVIRQAFCPDTATITRQVFIGFTPQQRADTIILYPGFNVISLDVDSSDNSTAAIFADIQNFESSPGNSNLNQVIGVHPDQSPTPLIYTEFFQTLATIRPGFGYVVNVDVLDTLIVSGTSIDPNLRVDLQAGFNVVGYVDDAPTTINAYFDSIIMDGNMSSIQTYEAGAQLVWTPFFATLNNVMNGQGYVLDVSAAYASNEWREDNYTSSNFEYIYGTTNLGADFAYYPVEVVDEQGSVMATFNLDAAGNFDPTFLFGIVQDVNSHETYGIPHGTALRFRIGDQLSTTTHIFEGGWLGNELNIEFESAVSSVNEQYESVRFQVFPNPARQQANLSFTTERSIANLRVDVINATGRMVGTQVLENVSGSQTLDLNVGDLPAGVYLVRIMGDGNFLGSDQLIIRR